MNNTHDDDGDSIVLTEEDIAHIQEEITRLDIEIAECGGSDLWRALNHQRRHLMAELAAGCRLLIEDTTSTWYDYKIILRELELGGGYRLRLLQDGKEGDGGVFPAHLDVAAALTWWDMQDQDQKTYWMTKAHSADPINAHYAHLLAEAWLDATETAGESMESRPKE
jgi:hypothetical protein